MNTEALKEKTRLGDIQKQDDQPASTTTKTKNNIQSNINKISIKKTNKPKLNNTSNMNKFRARASKPYQRIRKKHFNNARLIRSQSASCITSSKPPLQNRTMQQNMRQPVSKISNRTNLNFNFKKTRQPPMERTTYTNSNNNKRYSHKQFTPFSKHELRPRAGGKRVRIMPSAAGIHSNARYNPKPVKKEHPNVHPNGEHLNHLNTQSPHSTHSTHSTQSRASHSSHTSHASEGHHSQNEHAKTNGNMPINSTSTSTTATQSSAVTKMNTRAATAMSINSKVLQCLEAGTLIKIVTKQGEQIKGEVFCSIPQIPPICVMHKYNSHPRGTKQVYVVCIDEIASCEKFSQIETRDALQLTSIDEKEMQTRLADTLKLRCEMMKTLNPEVCDIIQELFDYLYRTTPEKCIWGHANSIVLNGFGLELCPPLYCELTPMKTKSWRDANRDRSLNSISKPLNLNAVGISENQSNSVQRSWIEQQIKQFWDENGKQASLLKFLNHKVHNPNTNPNASPNPNSNIEELREHRYLNQSSNFGFQNSGKSQCDDVNIIRNNTIANANASVNLQPYLVPPMYPQLMSQSQSQNRKQEANAIDNSKNNNTVSVQVSHGRGKPRGRGEYGVGSHIPPRLQRTSTHRNRGRSRGIGRTSGRGNTTQNSSAKVRAKGRGVSNISHINSTGTANGKQFSAATALQ